MNLVIAAIAGTAIGLVVAIPLVIFVVLPAARWWLDRGGKA